MPTIDLSNLSTAELRELIETASTAFYAAEAAQKAQEEQRRQQIGSAIATLDALLGPDDTAPYNPESGENATINGVLAHDTEDHSVLAAHAGLALSLILHGMQISVGTVLDLARVIGKGE